MIYEQAVIPRWILIRGNHWILDLLSVAAGVALLSILAQVAIPLPFTPVPITGQTLGVSLVALSWGRRRATATLLVYLLIGSLGAPIFAMGRAGFVWGPTIGYLVGMVVSSYVVGALADAGWTRSFRWAWLAASLGSVCVFSFGLLGLSFFLPADQLLMSGLLPFLPGDLIKNATSAAIVSHVDQRMPR